MKQSRLLRAILFASIVAISSARAEQDTIVGPVTGPHTMADVMGTLNAALVAIQSCNSGSSAPVNGPSGDPVHYQCWADTTSDPVLYKFYDGASWVTFGSLNTSTHVWTPYRNGAAIAGVATSSSAADLTTGTLPAARLPNPSASSLGGVQSLATVAHQWIDSISTSGIPHASQPAFSDISGVAAASQLPAPTSSTLGGVKSKVAVTHNFLTQIGTDGSVSQTQPAATDLSDLATGVAAALATPSSANIASAVTDETGSGKLVFGTAPNITTPTGIVKGDVGLGNVDNTSDATKWSATKTLTNTTYDTAGTGNSFSINGVAATGNTGTGAVVRAASPALTGTPTAPTASPSDNSTKIATTAYVDAQVAGGVSGVASLNGQTGALALIAQPQNRLSLTSGTSVTTSDVTGATSVYLSSGQSLTSDGTNLIPDVAAQLTLALDSNSGHTGYHQSGKNFDVFRINDSGTVRIGTGPAWSSDTARGTGAGTTEIHQFGNTGIWTAANTITIRFGSSSGDTVSVAADEAVYLGSFRTTADGQTEDSKAKRFLFNAFNIAKRTLVRNDATLSWPLAKAGSPGATGYSQANSNSANKVEVLAGQSGGAVDLVATGIFSPGTGGEFLSGIGLGSTTTSSHSQSSVAGGASSGPRVSSAAYYEGYLTLGYQAFNWLEQNFSDTGTVSSYGTSADARLKSGLHGEIWQ